MAVKHASYKCRSVANQLLEAGYQLGQIETALVKTSLVMISSCNPTLANFRYSRSTLIRSRFVGNVAIVVHSHGGAQRLSRNHVSVSVSASTACQCLFSTLLPLFCSIIALFSTWKRASLGLPFPCRRRHHCSRGSRTWLLACSIPFSSLLSLCSSTTPRPPLRSPSMSPSQAPIPFPSRDHGPGTLKGESEAGTIPTRTKNGHLLAPLPPVLQVSPLSFLAGHLNCLLGSTPS